MRYGAAEAWSRALSKRYRDPGMTRDIGLTADGYADAAAQDAFCTEGICTVSRLCEQSSIISSIIGFTAEVRL